MAKTILDIMRGGIKACEGSYGVEIEMEGRGFGDVGGSWKLEHDGSLKAGGAEYVLRKPSSKDKVEDEINLLYKQLDGMGARIEESYMAGVHVHVNAQRMTIEQLFTFFCTYIMLEKPLVKWCGESREGNHFCLRSSDAEYLIDKVMEALENRSLNPLNDINIRYASFNFCSLFKYGSVEFRAMRSTKNPEPVIEWVNILDQIKKYSMKFENPCRVIAEMSKLGPKAFSEQALGKFNHVANYGGSLVDIIDGMRIAQDIAFGFDWDSLKEKEDIPVNPFQKNVKANDKEF